MWLLHNMYIVPVFDQNIFQKNIDIYDIVPSAK